MRFAQGASQVLSLIPASDREQEVMQKNPMDTGFYGIDHHSVPTPIPNFDNPSPPMPTFTGKP
jgi:hypothetical protein